MVGVQDLKKVSFETLKWLEEGGRNRIESAVKKAFKEDAAVFGISIILPSDIIVYARRKGAVATVFWTFGKKERKEAQGLLEKVRERNSDLEESGIEEAYKHFHIEPDEVMTDTWWYGNQNYWKGVSIIEEIVPEGIETP